MGLIPQLMRAQWTEPLVYVKFSVVLVLFFVPLWFIFQGQNWARWLFVVLALGGYCLRLPELVRYTHAHSIWWILMHQWRVVVEIVATMLLFLPVSNRWFQNESDPDEA